MSISLLRVSFELGSGLRGPLIAVLVLGASGCPDVPEVQAASGQDEIVFRRICDTVCDCADERVGLLREAAGVGEKCRPICYALWDTIPDPTPRHCDDKLSELESKVRSAGLRSYDVATCRPLCSQIESVDQDSVSPPESDAISGVDRDPCARPESPWCPRGGHPR
jgi:hypothetical protein